MRGFAGAIFASEFEGHISQKTDPCATARAAARAESRRRFGSRFWPTAAHARAAIVSPPADDEDAAAAKGRDAAGPRGAAAAPPPPFARASPFADAGSGGARARAATRERVDNPHIEACALRGANERGEEGVYEHACFFLIEAQSHVKDCMSSLARMRQCTHSEHERRTTRDCQAQAVMNRVSTTVEPCYFHFVWGREHRRTKCS